MRARKAISMAQRARWAKHHALQAAANPDIEKKREGWRKAKRKERSDKGQKHIRKTSHNSKAMSAYWAGMTPKQRSAEMANRIKVRQANAAKKAAAAAAA